MGAYALFGDFCTGVKNLQCPLCHTIDTGKVGANQYYCWQCLMEFCLSKSEEHPRMFYVEADGTLVPVLTKSEL